MYTEWLFERIKRYWQSIAFFKFPSLKYGIRVFFISFVVNFNVIFFYVLLVRSKDTCRRIIERRFSSQRVFLQMSVEYFQSILSVRETRTRIGGIAHRSVMAGAGFRKIVNRKKCKKFFYMRARRSSLIFGRGHSIDRYFSTFFLQSNLVFLKSQKKEHYGCGIKSWPIRPADLSAAAGRNPRYLGL